MSRFFRKYAGGTLVYMSFTGFPFPVYLHE